jgi:hypothetical protein
LKINRQIFCVDTGRRGRGGGMGEERRKTNPIEV